MTINNSTKIDISDFNFTELEAQAVTLMQLLSGCPLTLTLKPEQLRRIETLAQAYRKHNKSLAFQLSEEFYTALLTPAILKQAYAQLLAQPIIRHSEFQIILDCLKDLCQGVESLSGPGMSLEKALQMLLLALTRSDKNSIYYNRLDTCTGKFRPTTFPLTENLIDQFLAPFGEVGQKAKKVLIFQRGQVMGNPAIIFAWEYKRRKQHYEQEKSYRDQLNDFQTSIVKPEPIKKSAPRLISDELEKILSNCADRDDQNALKAALKPESFGQLLDAAQNPNHDFGKQFQAICLQRLSPAKASLLSARMSMRLKRMMTEMGGWQEDYWRDFQSLMQSQGLWEGQEWLDKWRTQKKGKQVLSKSGQDYLSDEISNPLDQMLQKADQMRDKQKGLQMLTPGDASFWNKPKTTPIPPEQRKVLAVLARTDRLEEMLALSVSNDLLARTPVKLQHRLYQAFGLYADTDMDTVKQQYLSDLEGDELDSAKRLITGIERTFHRLASLFRQDFRMTFPLALKMLKDQEELVRQREKMNSPKYINTPAARYQSYQQGF
jgi:hypothetical protein